MLIRSASENLVRAQRFYMVRHWTILGEWLPGVRYVRESAVGTPKVSAVRSLEVVASRR